MGNLGEELEGPDYYDRLESTMENIRELLGAIYIQSMRNYDMLSIMADKLGADAKGLSNLHQQGQVLAPPPSFVFEEDEKNDD
jgi:hypothetical protein